MTPQQTAAMRQALIRDATHPKIDGMTVREANAYLLCLLQDCAIALEQKGRDWSLLEATQESLREHMSEIKRLRALVRAQQITIDKLEQQPAAPQQKDTLAQEEDLYDLAVKADNGGQP